MKNLTKKFIGLLALVFAMSLSSNAQEEVYLELPQGWSMFGYVSPEAIEAIEAFTEISDEIEMVKNDLGMAYIPAWGFSALGNLEYARGYQIKMINQVVDFQFESVIATTMDNNEAVLALEELLVQLQLDMVMLQDELMVNHTIQDNQISQLESNMMMMNEIEITNHTMQDYDITNNNIEIDMLQSEMMDNHMTQDVQITNNHMAQDDQITNNNMEIGVLQSEMMNIDMLQSELMNNHMTQDVQIINNNMEIDMLQSEMMNNYMTQDDIQNILNVMNATLATQAAQILSLQLDLANALSAIETLEDTTP